VCFTEHLLCVKVEELAEPALYEKSGVDGMVPERQYASLRALLRVKLLLKAIWVDVSLSVSVFS
jgi:hypothetical protein